VDKIERVLFLLSDLRGVNVSSVLSPGKLPGTSKLSVAVTPGARFEKNVDIDNYGSVYTGDYRLSGSFSVNSPFSRGDLFKLSANASTNGGMKFVRGAYQTPVGGSGLKLGAAVSALKYSLGTAAFEPLRASGDATVFSLFTLYPVVRNRNFNTFAQANYDRRNFHDVQATLAVDNKKVSDVLTLGLVGDSRDQWLGGGINNFSAGLTTGRLNILTPVQLTADQAATGRKTSGGFSKVNYGLGRQQLLWNKADNSQDRLVVYVSWQGQRAGKNLDNSEKFSLGGPSGVRGYAGGEATGDSGDLLSWELRKNIVDEKIKGDFVLSVFGDYGRINVNTNPLVTDVVNKISLVSHGFGLAWAIPDNFLLKATLAWRGSYTPTADPDPRRARVYVSLSKTL
jgi:hemolysin activation/secretion protein